MAKILNFGSLNIDYVYSLDHFVEAGETISSYKMEVFCGGKGLNQSIAASRAGCNVYHAGSTGKEGGILIDALKDSNVNTEHIKISEGPSGHAIIQVNKEGNNCIILFGGANREMDEAHIDSVLNRFEPEDILLLQNEINMMPYIIKKASQKRLKIYFNPSPMDGEIKKYPLELVSCFLVNEVEGFQITGCKEPDDILANMKKLFPASSVVLTIGKKGVVYNGPEGKYAHGIYDVPVVDTTAAGDTFTGYFLAAATEGKPIPEALKLASAASSISVSVKGASVSIPTRRQVEDFL